MIDWLLAHSTIFRELWWRYCWWSVGRWWEREGYARMEVGEFAYRPFGDRLPPDAAGRTITYGFREHFPEEADFYREEGWS